MKFLVLAVLCLVCAVSAKVLPRGLDDDDYADYSTADYAAMYGYPAETHKIQTEDGYILTVHRIPHGLKCTAADSKGPVLIQHGLLSSSFDWVVMGPGQGFAFILADRCYDVWMGNSRGNHYSREHTSLNPSKDEFWGFSWHEMGKYDVPAMIDYILHVTKKENLLYIGHSQGTTEFFIFNELHPEYESKVRAMFALAPIAFMGHSKSLALQIIAKFQTVINWIAQFIGINEFAPTDGFISVIGEAACRETHPTLEGLCTNILFLGCGYDSEQLNATAMGVIMAHVPAGASTKQLLHYAQSLNTGKFRQFDHGFIKNEIIYGSLEPPKYHLDKVTIPTYLVYANNDWLSALKDVEKLKNQLGNLAGEYFVPFAKFNHLDYLWAIDGPKLLYNPIIDIMDTL